MMEKAMYLKGLCDGLEPDKTTKEGKLIAALLDMVDALAEKGERAHDMTVAEVVLLDVILKGHGGGRADAVVGAQILVDDKIIGNLVFSNSLIDCSLSLICNVSFNILYIVLDRSSKSFIFRSCLWFDEDSYYNPNLACVCVEGKYRGKGYSNYILKYSVEELKSLGVGEAFLKSDLKGFYEKVGSGSFSISFSVEFGWLF